MTTYAVTGASGHLGRLIVESLLARGTAPADVVAIARTTAKVEDLAARGVEVRFGDYTDAASLDAALAGVDRLALVSGSEVGQRVAQHRAVIGAAERAGVSRLVYTSILAADTTSNPLAPEHLATEQALAASPIPATILRNSWYLENYTGQIGTYAATGTVLGATGGATIAAATRADYAEAAAVALLQDADGEVYELAGTRFTLADLASAVATATGAEIAHSDVTVERLAATFEEVGMDAGAAAFWAAIDGSIAKGELDTSRTDLEDLIGRPATPLADAVAAARP
ncbi:NAD(P)H-binding protein [Demequina sp. SYSU T00192]|uniref:NAD(P)H-binding protein n=1 Tax=Demequina litoralis TaxID=3051660 RepID=A0ABT8G6U9_9MICO|nr:NAD(P)H-binding protein [Demequina sp. SYSU T00192]MDN4474860.1 NAD(P)H-binding protein [Demequina sp. SYSU T00192]